VRDVRDKNSQLRKDFTGCRWFPVDPAYRITARFVPHGAPKPVIMANVLGDREPYTNPGVVVFTLHGQELRLEPVSAGPDRLFFVFRDGTSGNETYGAVSQHGQVAKRTGVLRFQQSGQPSVVSS
jgi:uncharacterized protein (DUF1684 family)